MTHPGRLLRMMVLAVLLLGVLAPIAAGLGMTLRSCGTCAHINETPQDGEDDPCANCGSNDLPNYVPINGSTSQSAASVQ